jgi:DNA modification methylase
VGVARSAVYQAQAEGAAMRILHGDCIELLVTLPAESIDACVTDPPYGIGFMGKAWDVFSPAATEQRVVCAASNTHVRGTNDRIVSDNPNLNGRLRSPAASPSAIQYDFSLTGLRMFQQWTESWGREVFRVLKPGAHILVCGAPRAYHRMACGLEDAGFEIRDCLAWLFGQGFPKSLNLGEGLGTALKPAHEPIVLARKPFKGSVTANVAKHGTGALNIDACRIDFHGPEDAAAAAAAAAHRANGDQCAGRGVYETGFRDGPSTIGPYLEKIEAGLGRWPANVVLDDLAAMVLDEQSGETGAAAPITGDEPSVPAKGDVIYGFRERVPGTFYGDTGGASRFYYVAKPSREERDFGIYDLAEKSGGERSGRVDGSAGIGPRSGARGSARNFHPTVKPVELMRWLVKLVTPIGGTVLDPFLGSGTTGMACRYEQREFIGIEREAEYIAIAERRIAAVAPLFTHESPPSGAAVDPHVGDTSSCPRALNLDLFSEDESTGGRRGCGR